MTATLKFKDDVLQKFFKPRSVTFALRDKIAAELDIIEQAYL